MNTSRLPTIFLPHGGGPCFFMDWNPPDAWDEIAAWLRSLPDRLSAAPKALLVVSAHWEASAFTVTGHARPVLIYDYSGFPEHTYRIEYPAHGAPELAEKVRALLAEAALPAQMDAQRGFDHGVFIPLKVAFPDAAIPIVQLSLRAGLDPAEHWRAGKALCALRDEGVLIVGSGMSFHNMRRFRFGPPADVDADSVAFDRWLAATVVQPEPARSEALKRWSQAPGGRDSHPREEHLIPLHVVVGAAGDDPGVQSFSGEVMGSAQSGFIFG